MALIKRGPIEAAFNSFERVLTRVFGRQLNPMFHLGALGFYFLWVCLASGIYVYIFFDTSIPGAYESVEYLTHDQKWFGGIMRSFHRYTSDGLMLVMLVHMFREWALGRLRVARWFSWVTGAPVFWLVVIAGISGYWLVWDELAQYIAVVSAEWLDALPLAGSAIARNFLTPESMTGRFFTLLIFVHIFAPLFLTFMLWIHVQRISKPKINPPWIMTGGVSLALLILSIYKPALSQPLADLSRMPTTIGLDWFYVGLYPLFDGIAGGYVWAITGAGTLLLIMLPWLPPGKKTKPAKVFLDHCNGCRRCQEDCPYNAIIMGPRSDGKPFEEEAIVNNALCVSCGICVGSCPSSTPFRRSEELVTGIDLQHLPLKALRAEAEKTCKEIKADKRIVVFGCERNPALKKLKTKHAGVVQLPCIGMLPPPFIDYVLSRDFADGVALLGCGEGDCFHRLGIRWTEERIDQIRDPYLRARVPREKILRLFSGGSAGSLDRRLEAFAVELNEQEKGDA